MLAVLVSGEGTTLKHFVASKIPIHLVVADRKCPAYAFARSKKIPTHLIERTDFSPAFEGKRGEYTIAVCEILRSYNISLVAMAGWKTLFSREMFDMFEGRVLNSHPSLLPEFKGPHAIREALAAGVVYTGCTIHRATAEMDAGEYLAQAAVWVYPNDTVATLRERIQSEERELYVDVIRSMLK